MFHNFNIRFLYPSELDLQQCELILCEECLMKILRSCLIPVKLTEYSPFESQPLDIATLDNSTLDIGMDIISNDNDSGNNENNGNLN
jgi:hypothetical protein